MSYTRFALYYLPPEGDLAAFGAAWLGWDAVRGVVVPQPDLPELNAATETPRKYGFHGTLKPPFRLAKRHDLSGLTAAVAVLAATTAPARCDGLALQRLGRFLALTPVGDASGLSRVAAACLREIDAFRAPPDAGELARRRGAHLSPAQEALLARWGYPYVLEAFRFHLTLTGKLPKAQVAEWERLLAAHLPPLPAPFVLDAVALVGGSSRSHVSRWAVERQGAVTVSGSGCATR